MGMIELISQVMMGIGALLFVGQLTGYFTSTVGVLGYALAGGLFVFGLILNLRFSKKEPETV